MTEATQGVERWSDPCQVCGGVVSPTDWRMDRDVEEVYPTAEMWPGGPIVEYGLYPECLRVTGTHMIVQPCGHEQPEPSKFRFYERTPRGRGSR